MGDDLPKIGDIGGDDFYKLTDVVGSDDFAAKVEVDLDDEFLKIGDIAGETIGETEKNLDVAPTHDPLAGMELPSVQAALVDDALVAPIEHEAAAPGQYPPQQAEPLVDLSMQHVEPVEMVIDTPDFHEPVIEHHVIDQSAVSAALDPDLHDVHDLGDLDGPGDLGAGPGG